MRVHVSACGPVYVQYAHAGVVFSSFNSSYGCSVNIYYAGQHVCSLISGPRWQALILHTSDSGNSSSRKNF